MLNTCCGFVISWQDVPFLPAPFVGWIPAVSCWLILALRLRLWSGGGITARSSRGKELICARYQMDKLFCAALDWNPNQNKTGPMGANRLAEERATRTGRQARVKTGTFSFYIVQTVKWCTATHWDKQAAGGSEVVLRDTSYFLKFITDQKMSAVKDQNKQLPTTDAVTNAIILRLIMKQPNERINVSVKFSSDCTNGKGNFIVKSISVLHKHPQIRPSFFNSAHVQIKPKKPTLAFLLYDNI